MNRDDIIRMAEKAGCGWIRNGTGPALFGEEQIAKFANLIAAYEREKCLEEVYDDGRYNPIDSCRKRIRARSEK